MNLFLDDERPACEGWVRVYLADQAIALLQTGQVIKTSLDHAWMMMTAALAAT